MKDRCSFPQKDRLTKAAAQARAAILNRKPGACHVQSYRCPAGGHYHVGHRYGRKRQKW